MSNLIEGGTQRSARTDTSMRDGDPGRGNPYESDGEEPTTDRDIGDAVPTAELDADAAEVVSAPPAVGTPETLEDTTGDEKAGVEAGSVSQLLDEFNEVGEDEDDDEDELVSRAASRAADSGDLPIADYTNLTVPQIVQRADGMSNADLQRLLAYERSHRRRKTLITKLERLSRTAE